MNGHVLQLFTTIDSEWLPYACLMIRSIRNHSAARLRYWIIHQDITPDRQQLVRAWAGDLDTEIQFVDYREHAGRIVDGWPLPARGGVAHRSAAAYWGRYLGRYLVDTSTRRAVYADVDMCAVADLLPLMRLDLGAHAVGAVEYQPARPSGAADGGQEQIFNNGLLVFDLDRFDAPACVESMQHVVNTTPRSLLPFGAQSAFSRTMRGRVTLIEPCWNVQGHLRESVGAAARLVHFTGPTKPWHTLSVDPLRWTVRALLQETPFPDAWRPDASWGRYARLAARHARTLVRRLR